MRDGRLAMAFHTPATDDILTSDNLASDEDDIWQRINVQGNNFGPGPPPPPEFLIPPPPLPDFMLKEIDGGRCVKPNLPDSLASCDITFSSFKPSGQVPGLFGGSSDDDANGSHVQFISIALGAIALFFLALCVGIFIAWRRCRSRNRLSYLRKTSSNFETTAETSEHPLIYDDANINFSNGANLMRAHGRLAVAHVNSYQLESSVRGNPFQHDRVIQSNSYHFDASTGTRSICRPDHFNVNDSNDNESRIYEELYLAEDHVYSDAHQGALPHLSDHYQQPAVTRATHSVSRSSTLNSIKKMFGFNTNTEHPKFMHYVPAPPQFMSPGTLSSDSLMMMSPDYSAVYHPLTLSHPEPHSNNLKSRVGDIYHLDTSPNNSKANDALASQLRGSTKCSNNMAESSFSSSSCSSGSTRPPSHNNSTTSTLPVACLSSSSCSCTSSTCQYQRTLSNANQRHPDEQQNVLNYLVDQPTRRHMKADPLVVHHPHMVSGTMWLPQPQRRHPEESNKNETFGIFSSLWRKRKSKTSGRPDRSKKFPHSSTTIFRLEPTHPSYPRMVSNPYKMPTPNLAHRTIADTNGNPQQPYANAALPPLPLAIGVQHVSSVQQSQRISFGPHSTTFSGPNQSMQMRQMDPPSHIRPYSTGVGSFGTPTMQRVGIRERSCRPDPATQNIHGTISNRIKRPRKRELNERSEEIQGEEDPTLRLPLLPGDEVWRPMPVATTLGKQTSRVASNSGVMPNPDDILPKKAWTDFSGTNNWPDFVDGTDSELLDNGGHQEDDDGHEVYENCNPSKSAPVPKERRFKSRSNLPDPLTFPKSPTRIEAEVQFLRPACNQTPDLNGLQEALVDDDDVENRSECENVYNNNGNGNHVSRRFGTASSSNSSIGSDDNCDGDDSNAAVPTRTYRATKLITLNKDGGTTGLIDPQTS